MKKLIEWVKSWMPEICVYRAYGRIHWVFVWFPKGKGKKKIWNIYYEDLPF